MGWLPDRPALEICGGWLLFILLWVTSLLAAFAQTPAPRHDRAVNVLAGNADAITKGEKLYATHCAGCHGKDARGGEGPNLYMSRVVLSSPDRRFFEILKNGMPGTEMAPQNLSEDQIWQIVSYVHSQTKPGQGPPVPGDVQAGHSVFVEAGCVRCHIAEGKGGVLGPDLSSIALQLSTPQIREAVLEPGKKIAEGFTAITVTTKKGRRIEGTLKNEDNFSLQMMSNLGELVALPRSEVSSVEVQERSLMPADVGKKLSPAQLQNLLAFLDQLRAPFVHSSIGFQTY